MNWKSDFLWAAMHILVLWGFAVAQPLFDLLSRNPEFFVVRHSQAIDIYVLILILVLGLPVGLIAVWIGAGLFGRWARQGVYFAVIASLTAGIVLQGLQQFQGLSGTFLVGGALLLGSAVAVGYQHFSAVRLFLSVLSPVIFLFPALFLFYSPVSSVLFAYEEPVGKPGVVAATAPIVLVVFDEFSLTSLMDEQHQIDPLRYPNFAALAHNATWFRNATTSAAATTYAVPTIITGNSPDPSRRLPTATDHPRNIFTLVGGSYDVQVFGALTELCPESLCEAVQESLPQRLQSLFSDLSLVYLHILLPADWRSELPSISNNWMDFAGSDSPLDSAATDKDFFKRLQKEFGQKKRNRSEQFVEFVNAIDATEKPTLYFLHILIPHEPYNYFPSGRIHSKGGNLVGFEAGKWSSDEWAALQAHQRYLLQVGFVDRLLGKLLNRLRDVGLYEQSLVAVTADHGVSFRPNDGRRNPSATNFFDIMPIPLFIKAPHQQTGVVSDRNVETIDILPTLTDILDIPLPWPVDGQSAMDPAVPERENKVIADAKVKKQHVYETSALEAKYETLQRQLRFFGSGRNKGKLFKIGPYPELIGRRLSDIGVAGRTDAEIELDQPMLFASVDLQSDFVPAYITGRAEWNGDAGSRLKLAIAVNGTIEAVTQTFSLEGSKNKWTALIEESAFQDGANDIEILTVTEQGNGQLKLRLPKEGVGISYAFLPSDEPNRATLTTADGMVIPIQPQALLGMVGQAERNKKGSLVLAGWAIDRQNAQLPKAIVVFANGKFVYSGRTSLHRRDILEKFADPAYQYSGFHFQVPAALLNEVGELADLRVFAVSQKGIASELKQGKRVNVGGIAPVHAKTGS